MGIYIYIKYQLDSIDTILLYIYYSISYRMFIICRYSRHQKTPAGQDLVRKLLQRGAQSMAPKVAKGVQAQSRDQKPIGEWRIYHDLPIENEGKWKFNQQTCGFILDLN